MLPAQRLAPTFKPSLYQAVRRSPSQAEYSQAQLDCQAGDCRCWRQGMVQPKVPYEPGSQPASPVVLVLAGGAGELVFKAAVRGNDAGPPLCSNSCAQVNILPVEEVTLIKQAGVLDGYLSQEHAGASDVFGRIIRAGRMTTVTQPESADAAPPRLKVVRSVAIVDS